MLTEKTLLFATTNAHKLSEIRQMLPDFNVQGLRDIHIQDDIPETGFTLEENAYLKAKYLFDITGKTSLAEDTGLEVHALDGAPGVHTARFAGDEKDEDKNMSKLLVLLKNSDNRQAQFRTVIVWIDDKNVHYFEGVVKGIIARVKSGNQGFGYDPVFIPEGHSLSFADLGTDIKNAISHRAKAIDKLRNFLDVVRSSDQG
ncbi:MAG: RdgB/HAM1 family non-canonical purine NTP pyrophosphatase [Saprospiraceae bacterium]|nr:RdgB/HAM1 family non-canonical purine NTP pyrophosphatase [Saprospiraceae bacterium]